MIKIKIFMGQQESPIRQLHDDLPQGFVLDPLFFNVYTAYIPVTVSRKFIYPEDDIALAVQDSAFQTTEVTLTKGLSVLKDDFINWKLKPNPAKTIGLFSS